MRQSKYTYEYLAPLVASSKSLAEVLGKLGVKTAGGNYRYLKSRIRALGLDTSHFTGQAWSRGLTAETSTAIAEMGRKHEIPDAELFVENFRFCMSGPRIVKRLLRQGYPYGCSICSISSWRGKPLTLHLDHINGINNDNRLENLRLLCPNCHQQTDTWGNRKLREALLAWG
jgi:hypothetical protein